MKVPDSDISIAAAGEADLGVGADRQSVAGRSRRGELGFDTWRLGGQIPYGKSAGFTSDNQSTAVRKQLTGTDVVIPVLKTEKEAFQTKSKGSI